MGKTSATFTRLRDVIRAGHADDFEAIVGTLRTPFDAVEAGDLGRSGLTCLIGLTADAPAVLSGAAKRVITQAAFSIFIVAMFEGRTGTDEEDILVQLLDTADSVVETIQDGSRTAATNYIVATVDQVNTIYDVDGNYAAIEIQVTANILRA